MTNPTDTLDNLHIKPGELSLRSIKYATDAEAENLTAAGDRVAIQDTREQLPLRLEMPTIRRGLQTGDYSLVGYESLITVERKSASDLIRCCGRDRQRFCRCVDRLLAFDFPLVVVENDWAAIVQETKRGRISAAFVERSCIAWMARGLPFIFRGDRQAAAEVVRKFLLRSAREHDRTTERRAAALAEA